MLFIENEHIAIARDISDEFFVLQQLFKPYDSHSQAVYTHIFIYGVYYGVVRNNLVEIIKK